VAGHVNVTGRSTSDDRRKSEGRAAPHFSDRTVFSHRLD
jgi:hypothetical protein